MTRLADEKPVYCASCFGQAPVRHVDFEAAYDGPVIPGAPANIPIDDLVICESCLQEAFELLDPQEHKARIAALEGELAERDQLIDERERTIQGLRASTNALVDSSVRRGPGKPRLEGIPDDMRRDIVSRQRTKGGKAKKAAEPAAPSIEPAEAAA